MTNVLFIAWKIRIIEYQATYTPNWPTTKAPICKYLYLNWLGNYYFGLALMKKTFVEGFVRISDDS